MKYNYNIILLPAVLLFAACGGKKNPQQTVFNREAIPVKVISLSSSNNSNIINATGLVSTESDAKYSFKIGGVIDRIFVTEGQKFAKGQLLATLKLTEIDAGVTQAKLGLEKVQRDYQRVVNLQKENVATLEQLQNSKTAVDIAQKQLETVSFNKQYANIYATNNGFVTKKIASEGEVVGVGTPILAINETSGKSGWILKVGLNDADWAAMQIGNKATIVLDAFPTLIFSAYVSKKLLASDQNSGSLLIELKLNTEGKQMALGLFGKAQIQTNVSTLSVTIPYDALIEANGNNAFVFVPATNNTVKKMPIVLNSFNNKEVLVASGLEDVNEIIVSNSAFLNEKSTIKIIK
jgi:RND family efflux transporter MFP subunit